MVYTPRTIKVKVTSDDVLTQAQLTSVLGAIAEIAHDYCSIPGCRTSLHMDEAADIVAALKENGYIISKELHK